MHDRYTTVRVELPINTHHPSKVDHLSAVRQPESSTNVFVFPLPTTTITPFLSNNFIFRNNYLSSPTVIETTAMFRPFGLPCLCDWRPAVNFHTVSLTAPTTFNTIRLQPPLNQARLSYRPATSLLPEFSIFQTG